MTISPRRILYLMDYLVGRTGGTERQILQLMKHLDRRMFEPRLMVFRNIPLQTNTGNSTAVKVLGIRKLWSPAAWWKMIKLSRLLRKTGTVLVHIYFNDASLLAPVFCKLGGAVVVVSRRDMGFWYTPAKLRLLRFSNRFVDRIVANSEAVKRNVIAAEGLSAGKVEVIYNGCEPDRFIAPLDSSFRSSHGIPESALLVGMVANLHPIKRPGDILRAFRIVLQTIPESWLVLVGGGTPEIKFFRQEATTLGIAHRTVFTGYIEDPVPVIKNCQVCVLCSESEGFSNSIVEYLGCGKPVVCTDAGGNPELVRDGWNGFLTGVSEIDDLADRIMLLLQDPAMASRLGQNGRAMLGERFSAPRIALEYQRLYQDLSDVLP